MTFLEKLLDHYRLDEDGYRQLTRPLSVADLPKEEAFPDLSKILIRIRNAIISKEKVVIYGDYDADGILATAILVDAFRILGIDVGYYVPNRYQDGYGIHKEKVLQFKKKNYSLIITVDNGVNAHEALGEAHALGIEVIITDHHEILDEVPPCVGVLHPFLTAEPFPMCGAAMALVLASALLGRHEDYHLALAAVATIADMMPLRSANRDLVRLGFQSINEHKFPTLTKLGNHYPYDETTLAMKVTPAINAVGRLVDNANINRLIKYFISQDAIEIDTIGDWVLELNKSRKERMSQAYDQLPPIEEGTKAIVHLTNEKEGMLGLLANRFVSKYGIPAAVFTVSSEDPTTLVGSVRTPMGYDLVPTFTYLKPWIIKGGGHANAGGLTVAQDKYASFKQEFGAYFATIEPQASVTAAIDISLLDVNWDNYRVLETFAPFGHDFPAPVFKLKGLATKNLTFIKDGKYLATKLSLDTKLLSFAISKETLADVAFIDVSGKLSVNNYNRTPELVFTIDTYEAR